MEFITRLYFACATSTALACAIITQQIAHPQDGLTHLQTLLDELPPGQTFNRLGVEFRVRQLTAVIAWLTESQTQLGLISR